MLGVRSRVCISNKSQVMPIHTLRTTGPNSKSEPPSGSYFMYSWICSCDQQMLLSQL